MVGFPSFQSIGATDCQMAHAEGGGAVQEDWRWIPHQEVDRVAGKGDGGRVGPDKP